MTFVACLGSVIPAVISLFVVPLLPAAVSLASLLVTAVTISINRVVFVAALVLAVVVQIPVFGVVMLTSGLSRFGRRKSVEAEDRRRTIEWRSVMPDACWRVVKCSGLGHCR